MGTHKDKLNIIQKPFVLLNVRAYRTTSKVAPEVLADASLLYLLAEAEVIGEYKLTDRAEWKVRAEIKPTIRIE